MGTAGRVDTPKLLIGTPDLRRGTASPSSVPSVSFVDTAVSRVRKAPVDDRMKPFLSPNHGIPVTFGRGVAQILPPARDPPP